MFTKRIYIITKYVLCHLTLIFSKNKNFNIFLYLTNFFSGGNIPITWLRVSLSLFSHSHSLSLSLLHTLSLPLSHSHSHSLSLSLSFSLPQTKLFDQCFFPRKGSFRSITPFLERLGKRTKRKLQND